MRPRLSAHAISAELIGETEISESSDSSKEAAVLEREVGAEMAQIMQHVSRSSFNF